MADTNTTNLNLVLPEVGASSDTWGTKINNDLTAIDNLFTTGPALLVSKGGTSATTAAGAATNLGLGTGDSPQFTAVNIGHASDTTITRSAAGVIAVEGGVIPKENRANSFTANQTIEVTDNTNAALRVTQLGSGLAIRVEDSANPDSTPFVVTSSGSVGIGTDAPAAGALVAAGGNTPTVGKVCVVGDSGGVSLALSDNVNSSLYIKHSNPVTLGTDTGGALSFSTNGFNERMRIDSNGIVSVGTASAVGIVTIKTPSGGEALTMIGRASDGYSRLESYDRSGTVRTGAIAFPEDGSIQFSRSNSGSLVQNLLIGTDGALTSQPTYDNTASGSAVVVTSGGLIRRTSSSIKYKKDVETLDPLLADNAIANLRPVWYRTKNAEGDDKASWSHIGLIAEEVDKVEKRLVRYRTVEVTSDENGNRVETVLENPEPEDVDYARLSVLLLDKLQRMDATIKVLETRIAALEAV